MVIVVVVVVVVVARRSRRCLNRGYEDSRISWVQRMTVS